MTTITVKFKIGTYLDYLGYLFPIDQTTGHYKATATCDLGRLLIGYAQVSPVPKAIHVGNGEKCVDIDLPDCDATQHLRDKFLYVGPGDESRLDYVLRALFHMDLINYYQWAISFGYQKKEAVEMFIVSRKLISADPYEAIHKRIYRLEQKKMVETTKKLLNKIRYFEQSVDKTGRK